MSHQQQDDAQQMAERYVRGEGSAEERMFFEELMLADDEVLERYMQVLGQLDGELPGLADSAAFAEQIAKHEEIIPYASRVMPLAPERPKRWYERVVAHYVIAASITMLFLFSGAFDRLLPEEPSEVPLSETPSYTEQLMNKTTSWLDKLLSR